MIYIILAMIIYSVAILFATAASRHANTNLAAAVINIFSALLPVAIVLPTLTKKSLQSQKFGVIMAVVTGLLIAVFVMTINKAYSQNKVGVVTPVVFGGAIFLSTIMSYFVFKEKVSQLQLAGLVVLAIGFGIVIYARAYAK